jgi:cell wall-associated NlpC family hydrolase
MSKHIPWARTRTAVAAVPAGIAAAFALQAPAANAAPAASVRLAGIARLAATSQQQSPGARLTHRYLPPRLRAYSWALRQKGHPYVWGGTGPGFDCSGLVMEAYLHAGIQLPRTTYEMLASRKLIRIIHPRMGDLAFYGTGHVELFRRWGYTFGAHDYGTLVGLIHYGYGWKPTAFYRVR